MAVGPFIYLVMRAPPLQNFVHCLVITTNIGNNSKTSVYVVVPSSAEILHWVTKTAWQASHWLIRKALHRKEPADLDSDKTMVKSGEEVW